jgi:hypothetical protein
LCAPFAFLDLCVTALLVPDIILCVDSQLLQAILFLCEVDNIAFALGLSERVRRRVETAGRVDLSDDEADSLAHTKAVHIGLIMIFVPASLFAAHVTASFAGCFVAMAPVWLGGIAEAFIPGATVGETARRVVETVLQALMGFCFGFMCFVAVEV